MEEIIETILDFIILIPVLIIGTVLTILLLPIAALVGIFLIFFLLIDEIANP